LQVCINNYRDRIKKLETQLIIEEVIVPMIWLMGIACLAFGVVIGVGFAGKLNASPSRIQDLENRIQQLNDTHSEYREGVSEHFGMTAELIQHMTESYREVYQHLAMGAQELCSTEVANKLLPAGSDDVFETREIEQNADLNPPKDYAAKEDPDQIGALAEDFGLEKSLPDTDAELASTAASTSAPVAETAEQNS